MFEVNKIKSHYCLTSSPEIEAICKPLVDNFHITFFAYVKIFSNGSHIRLSNDASWSMHYYEQNYFYENAANIPRENFSRYTLWSGLKRYPLFVDASENFNIDHGIFITENYSDTQEMFSFGSHRGNYSIINFYMQNLDLLDKFIFYFKERARKIIKKAELNQNRIYPDKDKINFKPQNNIQKQLLESNIVRFLENISIRKYYINDSDEFLSRREMDCFKLFIIGKSTTEISRLLNISKRTVETHINNIKIKFQCHTRSQLQDILKQSKSCNTLLSEKPDQVN